MSARLELLKKAFTDSTGIAIKGNHAVIVSDDRASFYYRGTPIVEWMFKTNEIVNLYTAFNNTASTKANQRKAREALGEFRFWCVDCHPLVQRGMSKEVASRFVKLVYKE